MNRRGFFKFLGLAPFGAIAAKEGLSQQSFSEGLPPSAINEAYEAVNEAARAMLISRPEFPIGYVMLTFSHYELVSDPGHNTALGMSAGAGRAVLHYKIFDGTKFVDLDSQEGAEIMRLKA